MHNIHDIVGMNDVKVCIYMQL